MTHNEINEAMGVVLSVAQYSELDSLYLNSGLEHDEFIRRVAMVSAFTRTNMNEEFAHQLINKSVEYQDEHLAQMAIDLIGRDSFIKYKIENGLHLFRKDRDYLLDKIGEEKLLEILNNQVA